MGKQVRYILLLCSLLLFSCDLNPIIPAASPPTVALVTPQALDSFILPTVTPTHTPTATATSIPTQTIAPESTGTLPALDTVIPIPPHFMELNQGLLSYLGADS
ncbi:MAG: hypothetical protein JNK32_05590, partial [Anaerolineales bacterium]|nr:hypothetical protein [Anaerolineales bacterium]